MMLTVITLAAISIHAPREGGDFEALLRAGHSKQISIHAPREGGDFDLQPVLRRYAISIHAPREGGDLAAAGGTP